MYKQLILASGLGWGLALSPGAMAKPESDSSFESRHGVQAERDSRHDDRRWDRREDNRREARRDDNHDWRGEARRNQGQRYEDRRRSEHRDEHRDEHRGEHRREARDDRRHDDRYSHHDHDRYYHHDRHRSRSNDRSHRYGHARWHRGDRIPDHYRSHRYVVHDYHAHRLYSPPRGHHWVRVDNDFVLTAVTTGVIVAVIYGALY